ncbi:MAG TPA: WhiB family transcriptional regulator [Candidatus Saccharimonadales bacterium]|nr:WhiB family transcriptional regulator [Candidatus Saccharimonadales bacterium]
MEQPLPPQLWPEEGECFRQADPELFFPVGEKTTSDKIAIEEAKSYCRRCTMADYCLKWALANEDHGIWGGMTANERQELKRQQKRQKSRAA